MHTTTVTLKSGEILEGYLTKFRPAEGFFHLMMMPSGTRTVQFNDVLIAVTEGERLGVDRDAEGRIVGTKIGDMDELARAKKHMRDAREHGWDGLNADTPLQDWEK